jgi:hypothetical protein
MSAHLSNPFVVQRLGQELADMPESNRVEWYFRPSPKARFSRVDRPLIGGFEPKFVSAPLRFNKAAGYSSPTGM